MANEDPEINRVSRELIESVMAKHGKREAERRTDREHVARQLLVFREHPRFPKDKVSFDRLVNAFVDACPTEHLLQGVIGHLFRTLKFAPLPADAYAAAELLAQQAAFAKAPSFRDEPGETDGMIGADISPEYIQRWRVIATRKADTRAEKAKQAVAQAILENYYRNHPESRPL